MTIFCKNSRSDPDTVSVISYDSKRPNLEFNQFQQCYKWKWVWVPISTYWGLGRIPNGSESKILLWFVWLSWNGLNEPAPVKKNSKNFIWVQVRLSFKQIWSQRRLFYFFIKPITNLTGYANTVALRQTIILFTGDRRCPGQNWNDPSRLSPPVVAAVRSTQPTHNQLTKL